MTKQELQLLAAQVGAQILKPLGLPSDKKTPVRGVLVLVNPETREAAYATTFPPRDTIEVLRASADELAAIFPPEKPQ